MSTSLYTKHRPTSLDEMFGNEITLKKLRSWVKNPKRSHSLLLTGPSGCGKTTAARILAKEIGCSEVDYSEMDTADFRGIDSIRDLRAKIPYLPMEGKCRVWLLDECHKLTGDAQNALLKGLEEPPEHAYIILATTDPDKLIKTIRTRCTAFSFEPLNDKECISLIGAVAKEERIKVNAKTIRMIADKSQGLPRQALSILEQVVNLDNPNVEISDIEETEKQTIDLCRAIMQKKPWKDVAAILKEVKTEPEGIRQAILGYATSCLLNGDQKAFFVLDAFIERGPFYEAGKARLATAAFEALISE